jgi:hypothetical protein
VDEISKGDLKGETCARPRFITFTGVDDSSSVAAMQELSSRYPIEWGVLLSPTPVGGRRFLSPAALSKLVTYGDLSLAAHLCGNYCRQVLDSGRTPIDQVLSAGFSRAQLNVREPGIDAGIVQRWAERLNIAPILKCRGAFPLDRRVSWIFDKSDGCGILPDRWPAPVGWLHGYAGGLKVENVVQQVKRIGLRARTYWIDIESGVRDQADRFCLAACELICQAVFSNDGKRNS